jgi:uncharacterized protein YfdQ (DUF2303 family)
MSNPKTEGTEYEAAFQRGYEAGAGQSVRALNPGAEGKPYVVLPEGFRLHDLSHMLDRPERITADVETYDVRSFCAYVNRFKQEDQTMIFGNHTKGSFRAEIDYHRPGVPSRSTHRANLVLEFSPEWLAWKAKDGAILNPQDLAKFIEEQLPVIHEPSGALLLTAIRHFRAERSVSYKRVLSDMDNRTLELNYTDGTRATGEVQVPAEFKLLIPVFKHGTPAEMLVKVEWKLHDEDKLTFTLRRQRPDDVRDAAFKTACDEIEAATGVPLLLGAA